MSIVSETNDGVKCVEFSEVIRIDEGSRSCGFMSRRCGRMVAWRCRNAP